jgi:hypothetical protein
VLARHRRQPPRRSGFGTRNWPCSLHQGRCTDRESRRINLGRGPYSQDAPLKRLPLRSTDNPLTNPCCLRVATAARMCAGYRYRALHQHRGLRFVLESVRVKRRSQRYVVNVSCVIRIPRSAAAARHGVIVTFAVRTRIRAPKKHLQSSGWLCRRLWSRELTISRVPSAHPAAAR